MKKLFDSPGLAGVDEAKGRPADFKPGDDDYYAVVDHDDDDRKTMIQEIVFPPLAEANAAGSTTTWLATGERGDVEVVRSFDQTFPRGVMRMMRINIEEQLLVYKEAEATIENLRRNVVVSERLMRVIMLQDLYSEIQG